MHMLRFRITCLRCRTVKRGGGGSQGSYQGAGSGVLALGPWPSLDGPARVSQEKVYALAWLLTRKYVNDIQNSNVNLSDKD